MGKKKNKSNVKKNITKKKVKRNSRSTTSKNKKVTASKNTSSVKKKTNSNVVDKKRPSTSHKKSVTNVSNGGNKKVIKKEDKSTNNNVVEKINKKLNKKLIVLIVGVLFILLVAILGFKLLFSSKKDKVVVNFENITIEEYNSLYKSKDLEYIYLYHDSCSKCYDYELNLDKLQSEYNIKIKKLDYSNFNDEELSSLKSSNSFLESGIDVPTIISIKDGKEVSSLDGIKDYSSLKNFVNVSNEPMSGKSFTKISVDEYVSLLNSKNKSFIYICNSIEDKCEKFTSSLEKTASNRKLKVNYLNLNNIISSSDWDKLSESNKIFNGQWFIPAILIVKNGKIIDYKMEELSESELINFLKENNL